VLPTGAVRMDLAFTAFLRRCAAGEQPGSPRLRGQWRDASCTCPPGPVGCQWAAETKRLPIRQVGQVTVVWPRPLQGTPKTATSSRRSMGKWDVTFSCACAEPSAWPVTGQPIGSAVGRQTFAPFALAKSFPTPAAVAKKTRLLPQHSAASGKQKRAHQNEQG